MPRGSSKDLAREAARWALQARATHQAAAERFNVARSAVRDAWKELGFGPKQTWRTKPAVEDAALWLAGQEDATLDAAAQRFDVSRAAIQRAWEKLNLGAYPGQKRCAQRRARALALVHDGASLEATLLGGRCTRGTLEQWCHAAGLQLPPTAKRRERASRLAALAPRLAEALELVRKGENYNSAAQRVGLAWRVVAEHCHAAGVKPKHTRRNGKVAEALAIMHREKLSVEQAAGRVGCAEASVRAKLKHLRKERVSLAEWYASGGLEAARRRVAKELAPDSPAVARGIELVRQGSSVRGAAIDAGVPIASLQRAVKRAEVEVSRYHTGVTAEAIQLMRRKGLSASAAARAVGCSPGVVYRKLQGQPRGRRSAKAAKPKTRARP